MWPFDRIFRRNKPKVLQPSIPVEPLYMHHGHVHTGPIPAPAPKTVRISKSSALPRNYGVPSGPAIRKPIAAEEDDNVVGPALTGLLISELLSDSSGAATPISPGVDSPPEAPATFEGFGGGQGGGGGASDSWDAPSVDSSSSSVDSSSSRDSSSFDSGSSSGSDFGS